MSALMIDFMDFLLADTTQAGYSLGHLLRNFHLLWIQVALFHMCPAPPARIVAVIRQVDLSTFVKLCYLAGMECESHLGIYNEV